MQEPAIPAEETARLLSLHALKLLDTHAEERFDRITRLAQRCFGVDICLISLVDTDRQWFKSKQGLDACETPRSISFCGHAILEEGVFVVGDARTDPRFSDNPLVVGEPFVRFYAGCPIRGPKGYRVGTLCIIDRLSRDFSTDDQSTLRDFTAVLEDELATATDAIIDEKTEIANRRGFNVAARNLFDVCRRTGEHAELLLFDIKNLKTITEANGHIFGDSLLRYFSKLLIGAFSDAKVVARIGEDEFAVLLLGSDSSPTALERLEQLTVDDDSIIATHLSWSVSSVSFDPEKHSSVDQLLDAADAQMYKNKLLRRSAHS